MCSDQLRTYDRSDSVVFLKTKEAFGGLSNMAGGFPLRVNGIRIFNSEVLYQACRFPHLPDVQKLVLSEASPMTAKMKTKPYRKDSRSDWNQVRVRIMRWCLRVKLVQNWKAFGELLLATEDKSIVEESYKDDFWGAKPVDRSTLVGMNVLGRLLMELREEFKSDRRDILLRVEPLQIPDFLLMGQPIPAIEALAQDNKRLVFGADTSMKSVGQPSLFDQPPLLAREKVAEPMREVNEKMPQTYAATKAAFVDLQPYPEYKDSDLPWLGQVPGHWQMRRAKVLLRERVEKGFPNEPLLAATQSKGVVRKEDYSTRTVTAQKDFHLLKLVEIGDFVISLRSFEGGIEVAHSRGIISPAYTVLEPRSKATSGYLRHFFKSPTFISSLTLFVTGIREGQNIDYERLSRAFLPLPPAEEQAAIVRYLDHALQRLDKAIRAKRKTIALLNEQKLAIIHRAVTRGLDSEVKLKDSGIPWLGQIPLHWEVRKIKSLASTVGGMTPNKATERFWGGITPWVSPKDMKVREIADAQDHITSAALRETSIGVIQPGAILIVVRGMILARTFPVALTMVPVTINQDMKALRPKKELNADYLVSLLTGIQREVLQLVEIAGHGTCCLRTDSWGAFMLPLPPIIEQEAITNFLKSELAIVDATSTRIEREIALLREYRTRLIADVVTGKLDVREAAACLPDADAAPVDELENAELDESVDDLAEEDA